MRVAQPLSHGDLGWPDFTENSGACPLGPLLHHLTTSNLDFEQFGKEFTGSWFGQ